MAKSWILKKQAGLEIFCKTLRISDRVSTDINIKLQVSDRRNYGC